MPPQFEHATSPVIEKQHPPAEVVVEAAAAPQEEPPISRFEATARSVVKEYHEVAQVLQRNEQYLSQLDQRLATLDAVLETIPFGTHTSADMQAEYARLTADREAFQRDVEEKRQDLARLQMDYEPFQTVWSAEADIGTRSAEMQSLQGEQMRLHQDAEALRAEWTEFETSAPAESARLQEQDVALANEQHVLWSQKAAAEEQQMQYEPWRPYTTHPDYQHLPEYAQIKTFLEQNGAHLVQIQERIKTIGQQRESLLGQKHDLQTRRHGILSRYTETMNKQSEVMERLAAAEHAYVQAQETHQRASQEVTRVITSRATTPSQELAN